MVVAAGTSRDRMRDASGRKKGSDVFVRRAQKRALAKAVTLPRQSIMTVFGTHLEALHAYKDNEVVERDASMRAFWSDRQICSHNMTQTYINASSVFLMTLGVSHRMEQTAASLCFSLHMVLIPLLSRNPNLLLVGNEKSFKTFLEKNSDPVHMRQDGHSTTKQWDSPDLARDVDHVSGYWISM